MPRRLNSILCVLGTTLLFSQSALAQTFPLTFELEEHQIQKPNTGIRIQARISQAKMPVGRASFSNVRVELMSGGASLCIWNAPLEVDVYDSILNLDISDMVCSNGRDMEANIAENGNLSFKVCLSDQNCLKQISFSTVPYAVKSIYAYETEQAHRAEVAAQAHYAHRIAADRNLIDSNQLGTGYFDFYTPSADEADKAYWLYTNYAAAHTGDGFISWAPLSTLEKRLNVCARDLNDNLVPLNEFVIHADDTITYGNLTVFGGLSDANGLTVATGDLEVATGHAKISAGNLDVTAGDASINGSLTVETGSVYANGDNGQGYSIISIGGIDAPVGVDVLGDAAGRIRVGATSGSPAVEISNNGVEVAIGATMTANQADIANLDVSTTAEFESAADFNADVRMGSAGDVLIGTTTGANIAAHDFTVDRPAYFQKDVEFVAGTTVSFMGEVNLPPSVGVTANDIECSGCVSRAEMDIGISPTPYEAVVDGTHPEALTNIGVVFFCNGYVDGPSGRRWFSAGQTIHLDGSQLHSPTPDPEMNETECRLFDSSDSPIPSVSCQLYFDEAGFHIKADNNDAYWSCGHNGTGPADWIETSTHPVELTCNAICLQ